MFNMETGPEALREYERIMGLNEDVLRFLNLNIEEVQDGPSIMMQAKLNVHRSQRDHADADTYVEKDDSSKMAGLIHDTVRNQTRSCSQTI